MQPLPRDEAQPVRYTFFWLRNRKKVQLLPREPPSPPPSPVFCLLQPLPINVRQDRGVLIIQHLRSGPGGGGHGVSPPHDGLRLPDRYKPEVAHSAKTEQTSFVSFRFVSFRFVSFRFVSFRFVQQCDSSSFSGFSKFVLARCRFLAQFTLRLFFFPPFTGTS